jgi:hypothetical protein
MNEPIGNPVGSPVGQGVPTHAQIAESLLPAQGVIGPAAAAIHQAIVAQLDTAQQAVDATQQSVHQSIMGQLTGPQAASDMVQNDLDAVILGQLGGAYGLAAEVPGVTVPTAAAIQAAIVEPGPIGAPVTPVLSPSSPVGSILPAIVPAASHTTTAYSEGLAPPPSSSPAYNPYPGGPPAGITGPPYWTDPLPPWPGPTGTCWFVVYYCTSGRIIGTFISGVGLSGVPDGQACQPSLIDPVVFDPLCGGAPLGPSPPGQPSPPAPPLPSPPPPGPPLPSPLPPIGTPGQPIHTPIIVAQPIPPPQPTGCTPAWIQGCILICQPPAGACCPPTDSYGNPIAPPIIVAQPIPLPIPLPPFPPPRGFPLPPPRRPFPRFPQPPEPSPEPPIGFVPPRPHPPGIRAVEQPMDAPAPFTTFTWPNWCNVDVYQQVAAIESTLSIDPDFNIWKLTGLLDADGNAQPDSYVYKIWKGLPGTVGDIFIAMGNTVNDAVRAGVALGGNTALAMSFPGLVKLLVEVLDHFTGIELKGVKLHANYLIDAISPDRIPGTDQFGTMLLADVVNDKQWRNGVSANDDCPDWQALVLDAGRFRPSYAEAYRLFKLGLWGGELTESDVQSYGFRREGDKQKMFELTRDFPGWNETVELSLHAAWDDDIATYLQLDAELDDTLGSQGKTYADAAGTDAELLKARWRGHWRMPSLGETLEAAYRFAPGVNPDGVVISDHEVDKLLQLNSVPPGWRSIQLELARPKMSRRELSALYTQGAITRDQFLKFLAGLGYTDALAGAIVTSYQTKKRLALAKEPDVASYLKGGVGEPGLRQLLPTLGAEPSDTDWIISYLRNLLSQEALERTVEAIHKGVLAGTISLADAVRQLTTSGLDINQATNYQLVWQQELTAGVKHADAAQAVKWFEAGLISSATLSTYLGLLNYVPEQIRFIVALGQQTINQKLQVQLERQTKAAQAAAKQAAREAQQAQQQAIRTAKANERLRVAAANVSQELADLDGITADAARVKVADAIGLYLQLPDSSPQGAIEVVEHAYALHKAKNGPAFEDAFQGLYRDLQGR